MLGVIDALANENPRDSIRVLSIGTGTVFLPLDADIGVLGQGPVRSSLIDDVKLLATSILDDPPDVATFQAHVVLGQPLPGPAARGVTVGALVRLNPPIQPVRDDEQAPWRLPKGFKEEEFSALVAMDMDAIREEDVTLIRKLGKAWLDGDVANQPIRANLHTLSCEIGHGRFPAAARHWLEITGATPMA
jgi:hypothetical protein